MWFEGKLPPVTLSTTHRMATKNYQQIRTAVSSKTKWTAAICLTSKRQRIEVGGWLDNIVLLTDSLSLTLFRLFMMSYWRQSYTSYVYKNKLLNFTTSYKIRTSSNIWPILKIHSLALTLIRWFSTNWLNIHLNSSVSLPGITLTINILPGSVATRLRCGGITYSNFIAEGDTGYAKCAPMTTTNDRTKREEESFAKRSQTQRLNDVPQHTL